MRSEVSAILVAILFQGAYGLGANTCKKCGELELRSNSSNTENTIFPWTVSIFIGEDTTLSCGGGVISATYVLTAAHCLLSHFEEDKRECLEAKIPQTCFYKPGEFHMTVIDRNGGTIRLDAARVIPQPAFNNQAFWNDIVLVELSRPFPCQGGQMPICLPPIDINVVNGDVSVVSWKNRVDKKGNKVTSHRKRSLKQIKNEYCSIVLPSKIENGDEDKIFCTIAKRSELNSNSVCSGDSGSITFAEYDGLYYALGVLSQHTSASCYYTDPAFFVRIYRYMEFIRQHVKDLPIPVNKEH